MKTSAKILSAVLLLVGLIAVNYIATDLPGRIDNTADKIYTLTAGTKSLLGKLEEPVVLTFYFSRDAKGLPIRYKNFATRVETMLGQYVSAGKGLVSLKIVSPEPDSPEEEQATAAGIATQMIPTTGEQIYFGLTAAQADQQETIAAFNPERESFIEYDLSQAIFRVQQFERPRLGLLTSLPLQAPAPNPMMPPQQAQQSQFVIAEWEKTFEIVPIEESATELPENLDALAVLHPQNLSPELQYGIDQFLLSGQPVFLAVDPANQFFKRQGRQQQMMGGPQPGVSSNLPTLLNAYGITYSPQNVTADLAHAMQVQTGGGGIVNFPVWINVKADTINRDSTPTANLDSLMFIEAGSLKVAEDRGYTITPLVTTSEQSGDVPSFSLQFTPPEQIARQLKPDGPRTLATLIQGTFRTAFPGGKPPPPPPADGEPTPPPEAPTQPGLAEGKSTLFVVADSDWLFDDYSVRRINFLGSQAAQPLNDNLSLASNALEFLAGSQDLISIRGRGNTNRPFVVVEAMEADAQKRYQDQLAALETRLSEVQQKLSSLQTQTTDAGRLVASPEVAATIESFRQEEAEMRRERRDIRRALREDINALRNRLIALNLLSTPLLLGIFGLWYYRNRKR